MRYLIFILFSIFTWNASQAQKIDWDEVKEAYFTKFQPTDTPAWIFPIVFEEGNGGRDTIYFGYDPRASSILQVDTQFGEYERRVNSRKFYSEWSFSGKPDSALKINIKDKSFGGTMISFYNGILPLTMWWDSKAFYSDTLPLKDQSPAPRAEGYLSTSGALQVAEVNYTSNICSWQFPIKLTDTVKIKNGCYRQDSLIYTNHAFGEGKYLYPLSFGIIEWNGTWVGFKDKTEKISFTIYPQPAKEKIKINSSLKKVDHLKIFSITGKKLINIINYYPPDNLDISKIPPGIYLIHIENNAEIFTQKFIKL